MKGEVEEAGLILPGEERALE